MWATLGKIALAILKKNNSPAFQRISGLANSYNSGREVYNSARSTFGGV